MKQIFRDLFKDLDDIKSKEATKESKQARGRAFESLLLDVFEDEKILQKRNRHTKDGKSEEIDGVIEVYNRIFLIEAKWVSSGLAASVLYSFIGKIENKFHGTLGVFISRNQLKKNFLRALNKGRRQSVIVIHGKDIDLFFEGKVKFKEYIEYAFKELSSENIVHLPVEEYVKIRDNKKSAKILIEKVESADKTGLKFVKEKLLSKPISRTELIVELAELGDEEKEKAFIFLFQKYSEFWFANLTGEKTFIIKNIDEFFETHEPKVETLKTLAKEYYTLLIFKAMQLYSRESFVQEFAKYYSGLGDETKKEFESSIAKLWKGNLGSFAVENSLTDILKPIWNELSDNLTKVLYRGYLDIYVSDRKNNHSQKKFAIQLVDGDKVPKDIVKDWLVEKLRASGRMYFNLSLEKVAFIVSTYRDILKLVEPDEKKWQKYVISTLYQKKTFTKDNNSITLTGSQKIDILNVQGSNDENLLVLSIGIAHTYFKDGASQRYYFSLISNLPNPANHLNNKILPVKKVFENGVNDKTEIKFENLNEVRLKVIYRIMD